MSKVRAGSVIKTEDDALWYCWGDWQLKETPESYPCMLAYVPEEHLPSELEKQKLIIVGGRSYVKVFGHFGQPINIHRTSLLEPRERMVHPISLGRLFFVRKSCIKAVEDPKPYVKTFLQEMDGASELFSSLVKILGISLKDIGISGSTLTVGKPTWRHEIDFFVYGREKSQKAYHAIEDNRNDFVFSRASLPPFHLPFQYQGRWFDPQFSVGDKEWPLLHKCSLTVVRRLKDQTLRVREDHEGIMYPAVYGVGQKRRLISFRTGHRKLFQKGQKIYFPSLSLIRINYPKGEEELAYAILHDEWGEMIS